MNLGVLDIVLGLVIIIMAIRCTMRGFVTEVLSFAAVILGILMALLFYDTGAALVGEYWKVSSWNPIISFLVIFLIVYLIIKIVEKAIDRLMEKIHLDKLDKALGLFLGLIEGILVSGIIVFLLTVQPFFEVQDALGSSYIANTLLFFIPHVQHSIQEIIPVEETALLRMAVFPG